MEGAAREAPAPSFSSERQTQVVPKIGLGEATTTYEHDGHDRLVKTLYPSKTTEYGVPASGNSGRFQKWFWIFCAVWCLTGIPVLLLSVGFSGGMPSWPTSDTAIPWILGWLLILSPMILFFFGRKDQ